jgi:hypothetical protein
MMDKVQITDPSNTAPSSKTFRDEEKMFLDGRAQDIPEAYCSLVSCPASKRIE